jgi:hypothetical protein
MESSNVSERPALPRWLWGAALLGLGALFGAAAGRRSVTVEPARAERVGSVAFSAAPAARSAPSADLQAQLQHRMLELMAQPQPTVALPSDDPQINEPTAAQRIDAVRLQPRDEAWAATTEHTLEQDLGRLATELAFRVHSVECRSSRCVAELDWPSGAEAQRDFKAVLSSQAHQLNCQRRLLLPSADVSPARGQLIVTCDDQPHAASSLPL